eukprot:1156100-Pelagomonas_calceolata.AAC.4
MKPTQTGGEETLLMSVKEKETCWLKLHHKAWNKDTSCPCKRYKRHARLHAGAVAHLLRTTVPGGRNATL